MAARPLWFLIWSGVFERHPKLNFGITEGSTYWANDILWHMDTRYLGTHASKKMSRDGIAGALTMKPSDYFDRNCFVGASDMDINELERRYMIGVGNMLWGNDFPHPEGAWPRARGVAQVDVQRPIDETRQMCSTRPRSTTSTSTPCKSSRRGVESRARSSGQVDDEANRALGAGQRGRFWLE